MYHKYIKLIRQGHHLTPLFCALTTFVIFYPFALMGIDFHHDGIMLKPAFDVYSGQVLFRDSFSQYGPLATYLHSLSLNVYPGLVSLRIFTVLMYAVAVFFLVAAWIMIDQQATAVAGYLLFLILVPFYNERWSLLPWSSVVALAFQSMTLYFICLAISRRKSALWPILVGICTALTFWTRPLIVGVGLIFAVGAIYCLLCIESEERRDLKRQAFILLGSFATILLLVIVAMSLAGAFIPFVEQNWLFPLRAYITEKNVQKVMTRGAIASLLALSCLLVLGLLILSWLRHRTKKGNDLRSGLNFPEKIRYGPKLILLLPALILIALLIDGMVSSDKGLFELLAGWLRQYALHFSLRDDNTRRVMLFFTLILALGVGLKICLFLLNSGHNTNRERLFVALGLISFASLLQYFPVFSRAQYFWSLAPACLVFPYLLHRLTRRNIFLTYAMIALIVAPTIFLIVTEARRKLARPSVRLASPAVFAGMNVSPGMAELVNNLETQIRSYLKSSPDSQLLVIGDDAMYCLFVDNLENLTPYYVTWEPSGLESEAEGQKRRNMIRQKRPIVVLGGSMLPVDPARVERFLTDNGYRKLFEVPYRETIWWHAGQLEEYNVGADDRLTAVICVPE